MEISPWIPLDHLHVKMAAESPEIPWGLQCSKEALRHADNGQCNCGMGMGGGEVGGKKATLTSFFLPLKLICRNQGTQILSPYQNKKKSVIPSVNNKIK